MVFAIQKLKNDYYGSVDFFPCWCIFGLLLLIGIIISSIFLKLKKKKLALLSIIITIIIIISIIGWIEFTINRRQNDIEYELKVNTNVTNEYTLYVPYLDNSKLKSKLKVKSADGKIDFIKLNYSQIQGSKNAIKITGYDDLSIYGKVQDDNWCNMSLMSGRSDDDYYFHWVWCNKTNINQNISIQIIASVDGSMQGNDWKTTQNRRPGFIYLNNGWNEINIRYGGWIV